MKAITIKPAWAWAIVHGRPVEIRSWRTEYRGQVAIHSSSSIAGADDDAALIKQQSGLDVPLELDCGAIVCTARLFGCIPVSELLATIDAHRGLQELFVGVRECEAMRKWLIFNGRPAAGFAWLLDGQWPTMPVDVKGKLGFWDVPDRLVRHVDLGFDGKVQP